MRRKKRHIPSRIIQKIQNQLYTFMPFIEFGLVVAMTILLIQCTPLAPSTPRNLGIPKVATKEHKDTDIKPQKTLVKKSLEFTISEKEFSNTAFLLKWKKHEPVRDTSSLNSIEAEKEANEADDSAEGKSVVGDIIRKNEAAVNDSAITAETADNSDFASISSETENQETTSQADDSNIILDIILETAEAQAWITDKSTSINLMQLEKAERIDSVIDIIKKIENTKEQKLNFDFQLVLAYGPDLDEAPEDKELNIEFRYAYDQSNAIFQLQNTEDTPLEAAFGLAKAIQLQIIQTVAEEQEATN